MKALLADWLLWAHFALRFGRKEANRRLFNKRVVRRRLSPAEIADLELEA